MEAVSSGCRGGCSCTHAFSRQSGARAWGWGGWGRAVRLWHREPHSVLAWGWARLPTQSCLCAFIQREPGPSRPGGPVVARRSQGPRPDGVKGPAGTPDPSSLTRMEASCLELALEGERLCKAGDFKAGVAFFEAAVQVGTEDLKTLSAIYSQLGNAYFYLKEYARALEYHKHDLLLAR